MADPENPPGGPPPSGGGAFQPPPDSAIRRPETDTPGDETLRREYTAPSEADFATQEAAISAAPELFPGIPAQLLDIKRSVEQQLMQSVSRSAAAGIRALESFSGTDNIQGVAIGSGHETSMPGAPPIASSAAPGEPTLTLYVAEPSSIDEAKAVLVDRMSIRAVSEDAVPVTIVVTGIIDAQPHRLRLRPAPCGISVGHYKITAGTIGANATGLNPPEASRLLILSNNHVLANSNNANFGDRILQPGPADGGNVNNDVIAILNSFVPVDFSGAPNFVDCATGWAYPDRVRREFMYLVNGVPTFFRVSSVPVAPVMGMAVGKSGRTTQVTNGRITGLGATIRVNYNGRVALFQDQIAIQANAGQFSAGGDSGSLIWTWNPQRNPVGLLFAGGGNTTFANRITRVLTALSIRLVT